MAIYKGATKVSANALTSGHNIENDGSELSARSAINFTPPLIATDNVGSDSSDISLSLTASDVPSLSADKITSGELGTDRIPDLDADKITSGEFGDARIPSLNASKINAGTFDDGRIPGLNASKITAGSFEVDRIPTLDATDKIDSSNGGTDATDGYVLTADGAGGVAWEEVPEGKIFQHGTSEITQETIRFSSSSFKTVIEDDLILLYISGLSADVISNGTFSVDRIPNLSADKVTSGTFDDARIPNLSASKINSGTFDSERIPDLNASKITSGTLSATARLNSISDGTNASDGQVLTADGSGGLSWEDASGGGGGSQTGTWTPTVDGFGGTITNVSGNYVKVGGMVLAYCQFTVPTNSDSSIVSINMSSLPFTAINGSVNGQLVGIAFSTGTNPGDSLGFNSGSLYNTLSEHKGKLMVSGNTFITSYNDLSSRKAFFSMVYATDE